MNNFDIKNKGENIMKGILTLEDVKKKTIILEISLNLLHYMVENVLY